MWQVQTFRTLIPGIHHQCNKLPQNQHLYKVNEKQNKHGEPRDSKLEGKSMSQNNGKGRP